MQSATHFSKWVVKSKGGRDAPPLTPASDGWTTARGRILLALRAHGPLTKKELGRLCDLSRPTIDKALRPLLAAGLVRPDGYSPSTVGRRSVLYTFNERYKYVLGIDWEIPQLNLVLTDLRGEVLSCYSGLLPLEERGDPIALLKFVADQIEAFLGEQRISSRDLLGVGLGAPAFLCRCGERLSFYGETLPPWRDVPVKAVLEEHVGVPVLLGNDAHFMALAESAHLETTERVLVYLALRRGAYGDIRMGGAVLLHGEIFGGAHGNAVSLRDAYLQLRQAGAGEEPERSGARDPLLGRGPRGGRRGDVRRLRRVLEDHLLVPMLHLITLFDPDRLVIQARMLREEEEAFVASCARRLQDRLGDRFPFRVSRARAGEWACAHGAALRVLQSTFDAPEAALVQRSSRNRNTAQRLCTKGGESALEPERSPSVGLG